MISEFQITPVRYRSATALVASMFRVPYPLKDKSAFLNMRVRAQLDYVPNVVPKKRPVRLLLEDIYKLGYWGFCRKQLRSKDAEIHFWLGKNQTANKLMGLFGHELAHSVGYANEMRAYKIGCITHFAYLMLKSVMKDRKDG